MGHTLRLREWVTLVEKLLEFQFPQTKIAQKGNEKQQIYILINQPHRGEVAFFFFTRIGFEACHCTSAICALKVISSKGFPYFLVM